MARSLLLMAWAAILGIVASSAPVLERQLVDQDAHPLAMCNDGTAPVSSPGLANRVASKLGTQRFDFDG